METEETAEDNSVISYEDFVKLDLRVATIREVHEIEGADKLLELRIDLGNERRTIVAGIKQHYKDEDLIGKQIVIVANLAPRKMKGVDSHGMLLAASDEDHSKILLLSPDNGAESGWKVM